MAALVKILLLGGTGEARVAANELAALGYDVTYSLAGVTTAPNLPDVKIHKGGFGGVKGLTQFIADKKIDCLIDATHPFAETMTRHAQAIDSVPVIHLVRKPWKSEQDMWRNVIDLKACVSVLRKTKPDQRVFLALGAKYLPEFFDLKQAFVARMIEVPETGIPDEFEIIQQGPPFDFASELELLKKHEVDLLVTRNSGTEASWPKVEAARALGLPVLMIEQPAPPTGINCTAAQLVACLSQTLAMNSGKSHID